MSGGARSAIEAIPTPERWGALCFYGEWFGGRPHENQHTLTDVLGDDALLVLSFDQGETLRVENPTGISVTEEGLRIAQASQVRWEWFYYGRPRTPANRYLIEYRVDSGGAIAVTDTGDWYTPHHEPTPSADAVAFLKLVVR